MRAVQLLGECKAVVVDRPEPQPGRGQVLLRMQAAGICGSDLHGYRAKAVDYPPLTRFVPGHEPSGVVAEVGPDVEGWSVGDRVVVYSRQTCERCRYCVAGMHNLCRNHQGVYGFGPDGADAEFMVANSQDLMSLPDDLTFVHGVLLACQLGTAYHPLKAMGIGGRDTIVVSGLGGVGLCAVILASSMGAHVIGVDPSEERRALAKVVGADATLDSTAERVGKAIRRLCSGGADKLVETSGAPDAHAAMVGALRPRGQAAIVGRGTRELCLKLRPLISDEIRIFGSSYFPKTDFDEIVDFVRGKHVPIDDIVTTELGIEDAPEGFRVAEEARGGKVVFRLA